jgi:tRNA synthetases class I (E and Q), anti-codon binding domain
MCLLVQHNNAPAFTHQIVVTTAVVDPSVKDAVAGTSYQFERLGFFVVDRDSRTDAVGGKIVFNRTATLRDGAGKPTTSTTNDTSSTTTAKNAPGRRLVKLVFKLTVFNNTIHIISTVHAEVVS